MPIKGLSDRGLAFPEIGQIRKGAKKGENRPGADLTYFRVEFDEAEKKATSDFQKAYGEKPTWIRILLPFDEIERMWDPWLEAYTAGRLVARSDGEFIHYQLDNTGEILVAQGLGKDGNKVPHPKDGIAGRDYQDKPIKFKPTGRLKLIIPDLGRAAYLTLMTTSTHDIANISAQLGAFKELNGGILKGIPMILRRRPKMISTPGEKGQRVRRAKSLVSIEADPTWVRAKLGEMKSLAMPDVDESLLLPAGEPDSVDAEIEPDEDDMGDFNQDYTDDAPLPEIKIIDPMSKVSVEKAAKHWNISTRDAAQAIAKAKLGNKMAEEDFSAFLDNPAQFAQ